MGFSGGSVTMRRLAVEGRAAKSVSPAVLKRIAECGFGNYKSAAQDDLEFGWVCPTHLFDVQFTEEKLAVGRFLHLWMRMDQKRVPGSILRSYQQQEEEAARDAGGGHLLSKEDRQRARDAAQARADDETRKGKFRRISAIPMLWDLEGNWVYVGALGDSIREKLTVLFTDTFDGRLTAMNCGTLAVKMLSERGGVRAFEDAAPFHLVDVRGDEGSDPLARNRLFVGREFLTWLWNRGDRGEGMFKFAADTVTLTLYRSMTLDCDFRISGRMTMVADDAPGSSESRAALAAGKQPTRAGLMVSSRAGEWSFTLDAVNMTISAFKIAESDEREKDRVARLESRFTQVRDVWRLMDGLYGMFLQERFGSQWTATAERLRRWARGESKAVTPQPRLASA